MSVDEPTDASLPSASEDEDDDGPQGVFGNLPQTRPGARSPRRDREAKPRAKARSKTAGAPSTEAEPNPASQRPSGEGRTPPGPGEPDAGGGIEDVAWAGVAAAAEAATIGVRLATRALEAMRDAVDRR